MFSNIGGKIKTLATILAILGMTGSFVYGAYLVSLAEEAPSLGITGFLVMIVGPLLSWISSFLLYGFGEIIDQLQDLNYNLQHPDIQDTKEAPVEIDDLPEL